jgi:crossover junction endodeoxyribonuclease RusA
MAKRPERPDDLSNPPLLDVCIHGQPVSWRTKRRAAFDVWIEKVRRECMASWTAGRPPIEGRVRLRVTHYYEVRVGDMDNIRKPIQDALQGIAYRNDTQVDDGADRRFSITGFDIDGPFVIPDYKSPLHEAFKVGGPFVHIEVWADPEQEVTR